MTFNLNIKIKIVFNNWLNKLKKKKKDLIKKKKKKKKKKLISILKDLINNNK